MAGNSGTRAQRLERSATTTSGRTTTCRGAATAIGDWHAAIPWLTGLAMATDRIRLGTMVASPNFRHPVTLAKEAMTLDHVSGGRLTSGLGAGGPGFDATVLGGAQPSPSARVARFAEFVDVLDELLRSRRRCRTAVSTTPSTTRA